MKIKGTSNVSKVLIISNREKFNAFLNLEYKCIHSHDITFYIPSNKESSINSEKINIKNFIKSFLGFKDIGLILEECEENDVLIINDYVSNNRTSNIALKIIIYEMKIWGIFVGLSVLNLIQKNNDNSHFIILLKASEFEDFFKVETDEESLKAIVLEYGFVIVIIDKTLRMACKGKYIEFNNLVITEIELASLLMVHLANYLKFNCNDLNHLERILHDEAKALAVIN